MPYDQPNLAAFLSDIAGEPIKPTIKPTGFDALTQTELGALRLIYWYRFAGPHNSSIDYNPKTKQYAVSVRNIDFTNHR